MKLDFHSHILPGIDDGAVDIDTSVFLAESMKDWGFERITCTPHITSKYKNTPAVRVNSNASTITMVYKILFFLINFSKYFF